jgi:hypothetical protein
MVKVKKVLAMLAAALPIAFVIIAGVVGLAVVAFFILFGFWMKAWGSYK